MNKTKFENISYEAHEKFFEKDADFLTRLKNTNTIENWRQGLMYDELLPLLNKNESWLALGDGMGTDANWLEQHHIDATATDISDYILKQAHQQGYRKCQQRRIAMTSSCVKKLTTIFLDHTLHYMK